MKISEMTTDKAMDTMVRIAVPASNVMHDDATVQLMKSITSGENDNGLNVIADNLIPIATVLLKSHRADVYEIVAALSGKTKKAIAEQRITETIRDIVDCWDQELLDFFGSLRK